MVDIVSRARRSEIMGRIKGRDTRPEVAVRKILHALGLRFRLHDRCLPGRPDITLQRHRKVVFDHGCFWHRHNCRGAYNPKSRVDFWQNKFARTKERDAQTAAAIKAAGWSSLTVWECELDDTDRLSRRLARTFKIRSKKTLSVPGQSNRDLVDCEGGEARLVRAFDLFCGAGGSSHGARRAGAKVVGGIDMCPIATATFA